ncbi:uncharacterized protein RCO7_03879 [Rhynchosporium graminicola]|uniref:Uncharacterized protein n=1 Tax=Rhynchosporium graminicola TaxID=2792576 RepID=A0A1E1LLM9_9HELO|nr:uncharacterized protein RCO7_03879 [Rhynchosporium commune]
MDFPTSTGVTQRPDIDPFIHPSNFTGLLSGKVGILTGASKGIDRTFNLALAVSGASLALLARSAANPVSIVARIETELGLIDIVIKNSGKNHMILSSAKEESIGLYNASRLSGYRYVFSWCFTGIRDAEVAGGVSGAFD